VKLPDVWSRATPIFDDGNLVSFAGLVPVMGLAERAGLSELISGRVEIKSSLVKSAGVNPAGKLTSIRTLGGHRRYRESEVRSLLDGNTNATVSA